MIDYGSLRLGICSFSIIGFRKSSVEACIAMDSPWEQNLRQVYYLEVDLEKHFRA